MDVDAMIGDMRALIEYTDMSCLLCLIAAAQPILGPICYTTYVTIILFVG